MSAELIAHLTNGENIFRITAADYNGVNFDGAPLQPVFPIDFHKHAGLTWLDEALKNGTLFMENRHETDYVNWGVKALDGEKIWGDPGDYIVRTLEGNIVLFHSKAFDLILAPMLTAARDMKMLLVSDPPIDYRLEQYEFDNGGGIFVEIKVGDTVVAKGLRMMEAETLVDQFRELDRVLGRDTISTPAT